MIPLALPAWVRGYQRALFTLFALSPLPLIAYVQMMPAPDQQFHNFLVHELVIGTAILISAVVTWIAWRCYLASGEPTLRWLTLGLLAMTLIYAPHGWLTRMAADNPPLFLLFGPASRCAMAAFWLFAFTRMQAPPDPPAIRGRASRWWPWLLLLLVVDGLIFQVAGDPAMPRSEIRLLLESAAVLMNLSALVLLLRDRSGSPLLRFFGFGLCFFVLSSASFFLAAPWNHQWWLGHVIFAAGFLTMSFGVARAYLATGNLVAVFNEEQMVQRLSELASTDELTGLANRRQFMSRFEDRLMGREPRPFALVLLDLDNFKVINDSLGHEAGDELLRALSTRLSHVIRPDDLLGRLGGDEFGLLVPGIRSEAEATHTLERLFQALKEPILFKGKRIQPMASMGVALFPADARARVDLLKAADAAMYVAKRQGRNCFRFHTREMNRQANERMDVEHRLREALARDQLVLHYQPQVDLTSGLICGAEALLRWHHPDQGLISAGRFIGIAEQSGLIHEIGNFVLQRACHDMRELSGWAPKPFSIAVNLSGHQLVDANIRRRVLSCIETAGLGEDALVLELEVTESTLLQSSHIIDLLAELRRQGVRLAIDDFGTGYSSLAQLHDLPVDRLKLASPFIHAMASNPDSLSVVRAVIRLGLDLGMEVLAEGVENEEQLLLLREAGCQQAQGFHFHRPMCAAALIELLGSEVSRSA